MAQKRPPILWSRVGVILSGIICLALGGLVLVRWHPDSLMRILALPTSPPMTYNAAVNFVLCGVGLLALAGGRLPLVRVSGFLVFGIGLGTFLQHLTGVDVGLDQALQLDDRASSSNPYPARMAPMTAFSFALGANVFFLVHRRIWTQPRLGYTTHSTFITFRTSLVGFIGAIVLSLGLQTLILYFTGLVAPYGWQGSYNMAIHTAGGLAVLGLGFLAVAWRESQDAHTGAPRWLPLLVGSGVATATLLLWQALLVEGHRQIDRTTYSVAQSMQSEITARMDARILALVRMAQRWEYAGALTQEQWQFEAELNLRYFPGYEAISWMDSPSQVRWMVSRDPLDTYQNLNLAFNEEKQKALKTGHAQRTIIVTQPLNLVQGEKGFAVLVPFFPEQIFGGFIVGLFSFQDLFGAIFKNMTPGYGVAISDGKEEVYRNSPLDQDHEREWSQQVKIEPYGVAWRARVWQEPGPLLQERSMLPSVALGAGLSLTVLLILMVALAQTARQRAHDVNAAYLSLSQEMLVRQRAEEELRLARDELEQRVQERTAALARANEGLQLEVHERERAETALAEHAQELARSNEELEQFAYVASHDLQEPLRKIVAFGGRMEMECKDALSESGKDYLARMQAAAGRMQTLIRDLLTLSRVTTRPQPLVLVDLSQIAQEVISDMEVRIQEVGGIIQVDDLPTIEADPMQMGALLQNLLSNALKFHKANGQPAVHIKAAVSQPESARGRADDTNLHHMCEIRIEDNGIGFEEKYLDRIFKPFQRLHGRGVYHGTGMGLAICRKIVQRHGGKITAHSALGQGAIFIVTLPVRSLHVKEKT